jgi:hypothetical protein
MANEILNHRSPELKGIVIRRPGITLRFASTLPPDLLHFQISERQAGYSYGCEPGIVWPIKQPVCWAALEKVAILLEGDAHELAAGAHLGLGK